MRLIAAFTFGISKETGILNVRDKAICIKICSALEKMHQA
jgi:hypothetical protein